MVGTGPTRLARFARLPVVAAASAAGPWWVRDDGRQLDAAGICILMT